MPRAAVQLEPNPDLVNLKTVNEALKQAHKFVVVSVGRDFACGLANDVCERPFGSPIEYIFWIWWQALRRVNGAYPQSGYELELGPQPVVELEGARYRLDFSVLPEDVDEWLDAERDHGVTFPHIGIELDGHDFHEKTKEQVIYRNKRDRLLQIAGWKVFHFSGSELHRNPRDVVTEAMEYSAHELTEFRRRVRSARQQLRLTVPSVRSRPGGLSTD